MRPGFLLFLAFLIGCSSSSPPADQSEAVANLRAQATAVERAMIEEDHKRMADLTHPSLVAYFGGRTQYIKTLETTAADLHRQGLKFHRFRFGNPSQIIESAGVTYAIYPYALELTGPKGEPASQASYLVCTSSDAGATWKFLDGVGVGSNRSKLKRVLSDFPDELSLPELGPWVVHQ